MGRSNKDAFRMKKRRFNETKNERVKRLELQRKRNSEKILHENLDHREERLYKMRSYSEYRLHQESEADRLHRINLVHNRLSQESEEQRAHRFGLIQDRLAKETEEQRAHRLGLIRDRLANETEEQRAHRLGLIQDRLANETEEQRAHRLGLIRDRLDNETEEQRAHRLGLIRDRLANETEEQRAHRLGLIRNRLANETEEQRAHRLGLIQDRLANETEEQHAHRFALIRDRLANESQEQNSQRLAAVRARSVESLFQETPEKKCARLSNVREAMRDRRSLSNFQDFEVAINVFADIECIICKKALYPQQRHTLQTERFASVLPAELLLFESIITCSRCIKCIKKFKVPAPAFWNNMKVGDIPPELSDLSETEKKFLCRVVPFLKIIKLQNRFCQDWCKGQTILFAQDVVEIAEQLPLDPHQSGLILVVENLENLHRSREFTVDMHKLQRALDWLILNNALYRDVRPHFERNIDTSEIVQIAKELPNATIVAQTNRYEQLDENTAILRGTFHQGDGRLSVTSRGKQCTAIAAVSCIAFFNSDPLLWSKSDIDYIILTGDKYYSECVAARENPILNEINSDYLSASELLPRISYCRKHFTISGYQEPAYNGHISNDNSSNGFPNLKKGISSFFREHTHGLLTTNYTTVALHCKNEEDGTTYWLFDSHARGPKGLKAPLRGTSCCMCFKDIDKLHAILYKNLYVKDVSNHDITLNVYSITPVVIERTEVTVQQPLEVESVNIAAPENRLNNITSQCDSVNREELILQPHIEKSTQNDVLPISSHETKFIISTSMLHNIDDSVPDIESVVYINNETTNKNLCVAEITRKTLPPLNIEREGRMEELAWYFLFPDGKNGFGESRNVPVTPLDYFQSRVMSMDKRFQRNDYLFYALSVVEYFRAKMSVSVSCRMRQGPGQHTPQCLVDNMHLTMRNVRGSASYWQKCCAELVAMVRSLGPPTWFLTFSCNDLNWPDMIKALLIADGRDTNDVECVSFEERQELVQKFPIVVARQFTVRVNALMKFLKSNVNCLGRPIVDFWYRVEFQNRGSPHLHMLVWCDNVPDFSTREGMLFIEKYVSCSLNPQCHYLKQLVEKLQIHKHTNTCYKDRSNIRCRFGFPRPPNEFTTCLGPEEALANNGRFCILKRTAEEGMVNNYNADLLTLWKGNIDIQPCGNVTSVAYYVAKYASKSEPHDTGEVVREAIKKAKKQGGKVWNQLFSVSMTILSQRLVSAPECAYRLCHLPLKMSSRKAVFVNSCKPNERFRLLRFDGKETCTYNNIFDRYTQRPEEIENISLAEFAVRYETISNNIWSEEDGDAELRETENESRRYIVLKNNIRMRIRTKPAVLRTRYYTLNSDKEAYYYSLLVCHVPFRDEKQLLLDGETAERCFLRRQGEIRPLQHNVNAEQFVYLEQIIQQAIAQALSLNLGRATGAEDEAAPRNFADEQLLFYDDDFCDIIDERSVMQDDLYLANINCLNLQQKDLFQKISSVIEKDLSGNEEQLLLFITGGAGSGKSFVLKLIVEHIKRCYAPTVDLLMKPIFVEVASLTGVAARQIFGKTLHSLLSLPIEKGNSATFRSVRGERLEQERRKWRHIKWLIIDEISMVSYENLRMAHLRLQEYKNNNKLFGGVNVLLFGDIMQLPPVKGHWCFQQPAIFAGEVNLWQQFSFCELTMNMRQRSDTEFIDLLNSLRVGDLTMAQLELLCERQRLPISTDFDDETVVRIYPTIKQVDTYNETMTVRMAKKNRVYKICAVDESREIASYGKRPPENVIPKDVNNCGGLLSNIMLGSESRVMLRRNISISDGLVNGTMGVVKSIKWPALRREQLEEGELPESVYIKFDDETVGEKLKNDDGFVAITPVCATFQATKGYGNVERRMLPLILSWAVTVHKLQGATLDKAVIDLGKKNFAKGQIYVALSRVKSLDGITISDLEASKLLNKPHDEKALEEMKRLRNLSD